MTTTYGQLESVVARTGCERFRWLTSEENPYAASREDYRLLVARLAEGEQPRPPTVKETLDSLDAVRRCPHLVPAACGCSFGRCSQYDRETSYRECLDCGRFATQEVRVGPLADEPTPS